MLWTICVVLLVLWALGMATSYTAGGLIHILLVIALVVLVIRLFSGTQGSWLRQAYASRWRFGQRIATKQLGE